MGFKKECITIQTCEKCNKPLAFAYDFEEEVYMGYCLDCQIYVYIDKES